MMSARRTFPRDFARPVKPLPAFDPKRSLRLEDKNCSVEVSRANGSITRIRDKKTGLDLLLEPRLAGSYRFALPIPGKEPWQTIEANWIFGKDQKLTAHRLDGNRPDVALGWSAAELPPRAVRRVGYHDDRTTRPRCLVRPEDRQLDPVCRRRDLLSGAGRHPGTWNDQGATPGNRNDPAIRSACFGAKRGQAAEQHSLHPPREFTTAAIFKVFNNMSRLGDQGPEQFYAYPETQPKPWVGFFSPKASKSVLIGARDSADRGLYLRLELSPPVPAPRAMTAIGRAHPNCEEHPSAWNSRLWTSRAAWSASRMKPRRSSSGFWTAAVRR